MYARTNSSRRAALPSVAAEKGQTADAGFPGDFQAMYGLAMDRAIGIEKSSLDAAVRWHACGLDLYTNGFWFAPGLDNLLDTAAQTLASCMEIQMNWISLMGLRAGIPVSSIPGAQAQQAAEAPEKHMDVAVGARAKSVA